MESNSKLRELVNSWVDSFTEQAWFQQLKTKWEELDPQSRTYLEFAAFGTVVFMVFALIISSIWSVHSLKKELTEKRTLLRTIQSANDEVRQLREGVPASALQSDNGSRVLENGAWAAYFETLATTVGIDKGNLNVSSEKAGPTGDQSKEMLFEVSLKHVNIKQVVRYAFSLENGQRPTKLRNLLLDTKGDPTGYLDATLAVSAFTLAVQK